MAYPGPKVHRPSRRKLSRGQGVYATGVTPTVTGAASTATINFSQPVVVTGQIPLAVSGLTIVSQTQPSPTQVQIVYSGTVATHAWTLPAGAANVGTYQGGPVLGASGTF